MVKELLRNRRMFFNAVVVLYSYAPNLSFESLSVLLLALARVLVEVAPPYTHTHTHTHGDGQHKCAGKYVHD